MSDVVDRANDTAQFSNDIALQQWQTEHAAPPQLVVDGVVECLDCGSDIPSERLAALPNCVRCIDCQIFHELREKQ